MVFAFVCLSKSHVKSKWIQKTKNNQETVISLAIVSLIIIMYILCLDISAIVFWHKRLDSIQSHVKLEENKWFDAEDSNNNNITKLNLAAVHTVLFVDVQWVIISLVIPILFQCKYCREHMKKCKLVINYDKYSMATLSLTILCPIFCVIAHSPYIAIAYLNDGDHASSIFIYYTILFYIFFGVTKLFVHWGYHIKPHKRTNIGASNPTFQQGDDCETHCVHPSVPVSSNSSTTQNGGASVGDFPSTTQNGGASVGDSLSTTQNGSASVGDSPSTTLNGGASVGDSLSTTQNGGASVGDSPSTTQNGGASVGDSPSTTQNGGASVGDSPSTTQNGGASVGDSPSTTQNGGASVGDSPSTTQNGGASVGDSPSTTQNGGASVGDSPSTTQNGGASVGDSPSTTQNGGASVGDSPSTTQNGGASVGDSPSTTQNGGASVGDSTSIQYGIFKGLFVSLFVGAILLLLGLVALIVCYLVLIPINKAISDAPNRLLSIYQSGGFLIGSFIMYKVIDYFYNKKKEEEDEKEKKKEIVYNILQDFYDKMKKDLEKKHSAVDSPA